MKLNVKAFALTCGLVWGAALFLLTWWIMAFDGSTGEPTLIGRLYRGYSISPAGSFIGLIWAFGDGLILGTIFAWLYNLVSSFRISSGLTHAEQPLLNKILDSAGDYDTYNK